VCCFISHSCARPSPDTIGSTRLNAHRRSAPGRLSDFETFKGTSEDRRALLAGQRLSRCAQHRLEPRHTTLVHIAALVMPAWGATDPAADLIARHSEIAVVTILGGDDRGRQVNQTRCCRLNYGLAVITWL
jgi:hypothetical protein